MDMFWVEYVTDNGKNDEVLVRASNKEKATKKFLKAFGKKTVISCVKRLYYWEERKDEQ